MTSFISMTQLVRAQVEQYQRVTWFLIECMEREHILTLRALASTWTPCPAALDMFSTPAATIRLGRGGARSCGANASMGSPVH